MLKIPCTDCLQEFKLTDCTPAKGKCPTPNCEWRYDIRQGLRKGIERHAENAGHA